MQQWNPCFHESSISFVNITCCFIPQSPKHLDLLGHLDQVNQGEFWKFQHHRTPPSIIFYPSKPHSPKNPPILGTKLMSSRPHPWCFNMDHIFMETNPSVFPRATFQRFLQRWEIPETKEVSKSSSKLSTSWRVLGLAMMIPWGA